MAFVADRTANGTSVLALFERGRITPPVLGQREGTTVSARVLAGKVLLLDAKYLDLWVRNRINVTVPSRHLLTSGCHLSAIRLAHHRHVPAACPPIGVATDSRGVHQRRSDFRC